MNTKVHPLIVKAAMPLFPAEISERLNTKIESGEHKDYTYLDLIMLGSKLEDDANTPCDIQDPEITHWLLKKTLVSETGPYQHWVEHFWNTKVEIKEGEKNGLILDSDYICSVVEEALGFDYLKPLFGDLVSDIIEEIASLITKAIDGTTVLGSFRSAPERAEEYWNKLLEQYQNGEYEKAYINLGRVCHLLADMATPAHVHGDAHAGFSWVRKVLDFLDFPSELSKKIGANTKVDDDDYEDYTGSVIDDVDDDDPTQMQIDMDYCKAIPDAWNVDSTCRAIYRTDWELFDYFKDMASYTAQYDSDDVDGTQNSQPYHWKHLRIYDPNTWAIERDLQDDLTDYACNAIACDLIPSAIMHTAGLIDYFFYTVGEDYIKEAVSQSIKVQTEKIKVFDDTDPCGPGEIYLTVTACGNKKSSGRIKINTGEEKSLINKSLSFNFAYAEKPIYISSSAYDNDDVLFIKMRESLGSFDEAIPYTDIEDETKKFFTTRSKMKSGDNGKYELTYSITKKKKKKVQAAYSMVKNCETVDAKRLQKLRRSKYKIGDNSRMSPIFINSNSMNRHFPTKRHMACGHWKNATERGFNQSFYLYDYELFKKTPDSIDQNLVTLKKLCKNKDIDINPEHVDSLCKEWEEFPDKDKTIFYHGFAKMGNNSSKALDKIANINENNFYDSFHTTCNCCTDEAQIWMLREQKITSAKLITLNRK